jgi:hypothetical protein
LISAPQPTIRNAEDSPGIRVTCSDLLRAPKCSRVSLVMFAAKPCGPVSVSAAATWLAGVDIVLSEIVCMATSLGRLLLFRGSVIQDYWAARSP